MARGITYVLIGLLTFLVIGFLILTYSIDSIVKSNIENAGTEMTGTRVTVDNVSISPFSGEGTISGFRIENPEGFSTDHAFVADDFYIKMDVFTLFSDVIEVNEIRLTGPAIYVEQKLTGNNLRTILNNLDEAAESETGTHGELAIGYFLMENGSADLYTEIGGERSARVEVSVIELHDLGGDQVAEQVLREIAGRIVEQALQAAARSGAEQLRDAIRDIFD